MVTPLLTIVTPTLNAMDTVARTIECVASLSATNSARDSAKNSATNTPVTQTIQHIVVDGGSTDGTLQYLQEQRSIQLLCQTGQGISQAINQGIASAQGNFIAVLNADDYYLDDIKQVLTILEQDSADNLNNTVYCANAILYDPLSNTDIKREAQPNQMPYFMSVYHPSMFVPKKVHDQFGNYDETYRLAMDCEFVHRLMANKVQLQHLPYTTSCMQLRGTSHVNHVRAMGEFEQSVIHHGLLSANKARYYRIRQTILHSMLRSPLCQRIWLKLRRLTPKSSAKII